MTTEQIPLAVWGFRAMLTVMSAGLVANTVRDMDTENSWSWITLMVIFVIAVYLCVEGFRLTSLAKQFAYEMEQEEKEDPDALMYGQHASNADFPTEEIPVVKVARDGRHER
jgi:hypothetical protein